MRKLANYKWSFLLGLIGVGLLGMAGLSLINSFRGSGIPLTAPGETVVTIDKAGDYTLWNATKTIQDGQLVSFVDDLPPGTIVAIVKQPGGTVVPWRLPTGKSSVEVNGERKVAAGEVTFSSPGKYKVVVSGFEGKRALSLDESKFWKTFLNTLIYGFGGVVFLFAAIALGIYVAVRLSKQGREEAGSLRKNPPVLR
jgi:hypothetical protein